MAGAPVVVQELSALFGLFDVNGDGAITAAEVEQVLSAFGGIIAAEEAAALRALIAADARRRIRSDSSSSLV